jgi:ABC-type antimicrobial peptide transport system permease subunit
MNKKILGIIIVLMAVAILTTPLLGITYAKKSTFVNGTQMITNFIPLGEIPKGKSDNVLMTSTLFVTWSGDIAGDTEYERRLMLHKWVPPSGGPETKVNIHERIYFPTVTVLGKTGSLTLAVNLGGSKGVFRWTIIEGTGELANLHGNGRYWLDEAPFYDYEGYVHFDP